MVQVQDSAAQTRRLRPYTSYGAVAHDRIVMLESCEGVYAVVFISFSNAFSTAVLENEVAVPDIRSLKCFHPTCPKEIEPR